MHANLTRFNITLPLSLHSHQYHISIGKAIQKVSWYMHELYDMINKAIKIKKKLKKTIWKKYAII